MLLCRFMAPRFDPHLGNEQPYEAIRDLWARDGEECRNGLGVTSGIVHSDPVRLIL